MINAYILASGSKGNATLVFNEETSILIDFGISKSELIEKLSSLGKNFADIDYFLFTHAHSDHIKSYEFTDIDKRYSLKGVVPLKDENTLKAYKEYVLGGFIVTPIKASHDVEPTCGYVIEDKESSLVYLTDTGKIGKRTFDLMKNRTFYIIESNHDVKMLMDSDRSDILKRRIVSTKGHLSNEDSAFYVSSLLGVETKTIVLAHLSEECNSPEKALKTYKEVFSLKQLDFDRYKIHCASQHDIVKLW